MKAVRANDIYFELSLMPYSKYSRAPYILPKKTEFGDVLWICTGVYFCFLVV